MEECYVSWRRRDLKQAVGTPPKRRQSSHYKNRSWKQPQCTQDCLPRKKPAHASAEEATKSKPHRNHAVPSFGVVYSNAINFCVCCCARTELRMGRTRWILLMVYGLSIVQVECRWQNFRGLAPLLPSPPPNGA